jgi:hypothetical protein
MHLLVICDNKYTKNIRLHKPRYIIYTHNAGDHNL